MLTRPSCEQPEEPKPDDAPGDAPAAKRQGPGLGGEVEAPGSEDTFMAALLRAQKDGNDIVSESEGRSVLAVRSADVRSFFSQITMSFGNPGGWTSGPMSAVASRIAAQGTAITISGGNDGVQGAFFTDDPSSAELGMSVAVVQSSDLVGFPAQLSGAGDMKELFILSAGLFPFAEGQSRTLSLYAANDDCSDVPEGDNSGKLAVLSSGDCKAALFAQGFKYVLVAFEPAPASTDYFRDNKPDQQSANIYREDFFKLREATANGRQATITFDAGTRLESRPNNVDGGVLNAMSSFGPTTDMFINPNVAAPG